MDIDIEDRGKSKPARDLKNHYQPMSVLLSTPTLAWTCSAVLVVIYFKWIHKRNKTLRKRMNYLPRNAENITLDELQKYFSKELVSFTIEPLVVVVANGVERADCGGASGSELTRLRLYWSDSAKQKKQKRPRTAIVKITNLMDMPVRPFLSRLVEWFIDFSTVRILFNEFNFFANVGPTYFPKPLSMECIPNTDNATTTTTTTTVFSSSTATASSLTQTQTDARVPKTYVALAAPASNSTPEEAFLLFRLLGTRQEYRTLSIIEDFLHLKSGFVGMECDEQNSTLAIRNLARFHSKFWNNQEYLKTHLLCTFQANVVAGTNSGPNGLWALRKMQTWHVDDALENCIYKWSQPDHIEFLQSFGLEQLFTTTEANACRAVRQKMLKDADFFSRVFGTGVPQTLCHGDFHSGNVLWDPMCNTDEW